MPWHFRLFQLTRCWCVTKTSSRSFAPTPANFFLPRKYNSTWPARLSRRAYWFLSPYCVQANLFFLVAFGFFCHASKWFFFLSSPAFFFTVFLFYYVVLFFIFILTFCVLIPECARRRFGTTWFDQFECFDSLRAQPRPRGHRRQGMGLPLVLVPSVIHAFSCVQHVFLCFARFRPPGSALPVGSVQWQAGSAQQPLCAPARRRLACLYIAPQRNLYSASRSAAALSVAPCGVFVIVSISIYLVDRVLLDNEFVCANFNKYVNSDFPI